MHIISLHEDMYLAMSMYIDILNIFYIYICIWQVESSTVEYKQNVRVQIEIY